MKKQNNNLIIDPNDLIGEDSEFEDKQIEIKKRIEKEKQFVKLFKFYNLTHGQLRNTAIKYGYVNGIYKSFMFYKNNLQLIENELDYLINKNCNNFLKQEIKNDLELLKEYIRLVIQIHVDDFLLLNNPVLTYLSRILTVRDKVKVFFKSSIDLIVINEGACKSFKKPSYREYNLITKSKEYQKVDLLTDIKKITKQIDKYNYKIEKYFLDNKLNHIDALNEIIYDFEMINRKKLMKIIAARLITIEKLDIYFKDINKNLLE